MCFGHAHWNQLGVTGSSLLGDDAVIVSVILPMSLAEVALVVALKGFDGCGAVSPYLKCIWEGRDLWYPIDCNLCAG